MLSGGGVRSTRIRMNRMAVTGQLLAGGCQATYQQLTAVRRRYLAANSKSTRPVVASEVVVELQPGAGIYL